MKTSKGGRPRHAPTAQSRATVETFAAFGIPQEDIARVIGITQPTLRLHYRDELDLGSVKANVKVITNLFTVACKPTREGVDAAKFWVRMRVGWAAPVTQSVEEQTIGKKAKRQAKAEQSASGGKFAVPQAPKLVVSNG